jgi:hypothetical protein
MLKVLPKPEGFDLREKRAEKSESARDWLPEDALYDAATHIAEKGVAGALVICWYELSESGLPIAKYRCYNEDPRSSTALMADVEFQMQLSCRGQ